MQPHIIPEIFIDSLSTMLTPADMANLKCVDRCWRNVVTLIEKFRAEKAKAIINSGTSHLWRKTNFLRLRSAIDPPCSVLCSKYLRVYKIMNDIHLTTPKGDIVGVIDTNNVLYKSIDTWANLYDAILLVLDSLPPTMTLGSFCKHCPFCGKCKRVKCHCGMKWARWFNRLLPRRVCVGRAVFRLSEDLTLFCDRHVFMDNCNNGNRDH